MRASQVIRVAIVFFAWIIAGITTGLFIAAAIVQRSLQGVEPDGTTGVTFFCLCAILLPTGALIGSIIGAYAVFMLRKGH